MNLLSRWLLTLVIPALLASTALAEGYTEGKQYQVLANPQPTGSGDKIEVVELFWYGCTNSTSSGLLASHLSIQGSR